MTKKTVFEILEIDETKDEAILNSAYRKKLVVTNLKISQKNLRL